MSSSCTTTRRTRLWCLCVDEKSSAWMPYFLIHAQHHRLVLLFVVQADDSDDLSTTGVGGQLEGAG